MPMGAYQVSGEYSMLHAAFERGWLEPRARHDGVAAVDPPRRRGLYRDLLRKGCSEGAWLGVSTAGGARRVQAGAWNQASAEVSSRRS